jgi:hypothetical protein
MLNVSHTITDAPMSPSAPLSPMINSGLNARIVAATKQINGMIKPKAALLQLLSLFCSLIKTYIEINNVGAIIINLSISIPCKALIDTLLPILSKHRIIV